MPTIQFRTDETAKAQYSALYNAVTLAALADMEDSKGQKICGKDIRTVLAELKAD